MGIFSKIASALGSPGAGSNRVSAAPSRVNNNTNAANSKGSVRTNTNKPSTRVHWPNPMDPNSTPWSLTGVLNNPNKPTSAGPSGAGPVRKGSGKPSTGAYWPNPMEPNSTPWSLTNILNNMNKPGTPTPTGSSGANPVRKDSDTGGTNKPNTGVPSPEPYYQTSKEAIDAYMSGTYFWPTWEKAKERNPLLTDDALLENYGAEVYSSVPKDVGYYMPGDPTLKNIVTDKDRIAALERKANEAHATKLRQSPDYIAKDYDEYVDMVNQGLIAPAVKLDTTGKQISIPYGTYKEDYNAYLQRRYADNGDDYYNRNYGELAKSDPNFWKGSPEAFDADGKPVDTNTYLWLLNNPLTSTVLQGMDASGNFSGAGPTMEQLARDPSNGGYGLYSERNVADMYASHILAGDEMGAMLESNPKLLNAILTQAYTPIVDPNNPVTYKPYMKTTPDGPDDAMWGTLNLAEGSKTPAQLAAEFLADPTSASGMNNLQILAAVNELNNQDTTTPDDTGSGGSGGGGSGGGGNGGGNMPAGGNPETTDTLYSMPEVGNYAARMILNKMLPTGYDYDYNKRLDKRLADIAAAEQVYKGNVLPSVERTYQDQAANTLANLVAALRANRASGLTSGASRGAQAASDVQAVQAASKENSENLRKLVNDNLASFLTQLASKRATAGNDTASELQGYASPMMTALGEVLAQYNYGSAAAQVNNGGLRRMQSYLV